VESQECLNKDLVFSPQCQQREKIDWQEAHKFDCWLEGTIFIFCCPSSISQDIGEWPQNQILIPDWTYFHCPGTTLPHG